MKLTAEGLAGLKRLAEIARMAPEDRRDPRLEAAAKFIDSLGDGPIERWVYTAKGDGGCASCPFETLYKPGPLCSLALYFNDELACTYDEPPEQCRLPVLVDGVRP